MVGTVITTRFDQLVHLSLLLQDLSLGHILRNINQSIYEWPQRFLTKLNPQRLAQNFIRLQQKRVPDVVILIGHRYTTRQLDQIGQEYLRDPLHQNPIAAVLVLDPRAKDAAVDHFWIGVGGSVLSCHGGI